MTLRDYKAWKHQNVAQWVVNLSLFKMLSATEQKYLVQQSYNYLLFDKWNFEIATNQGHSYWDTAVMPSTAQPFVGFGGSNLDNMQDMARNTIINRMLRNSSVDVMSKMSLLCCRDVSMLTS